MITNNTFTTKPEAVTELNELRKDLIVWAQNQVTGKRTQAAIATRKHVTDTLNAKAESYDFVASFLQTLIIKDKQEEKPSTVYSGGDASGTYNGTEYQGDSAYYMPHYRDK